MLRKNLDLLFLVGALIIVFGVIGLRMAEQSSAVSQWTPPEGLPTASSGSVSGASSAPDPISQTLQLIVRQCDESATELRAGVRRAARILSDKGVATTEQEAARGLVRAVEGSPVTNCLEALATWMVIRERL